jgi:hypothetical protein
MNRIETEPKRAPAPTSTVKYFSLSSIAFSQFSLFFCFSASGFAKQNKIAVGVFDKTTDAGNRVQVYQAHNVPTLTAKA